MEKFVGKKLENKVLVKFIGVSGNKKTGDVSQTYSSENTCPARCPFKHNGCYAEYGHCNGWWMKTNAGEGKNVVPVDDLKEVVENTPHTNLVRHNVAGDLAKHGTSNIDKRLLNKLIEAFDGLQVYTYTHCEINAHNTKAIKEAKEKGFVINYSTESIKDAKKALKSGCPAVISCKSIKASVVKHDGLTIVQCPATINENVKCKDCRLCAKADRPVVVAFPVHGAGAKKAHKFLTDL